MSKNPNCVHDSSIEYTEECIYCVRYERDTLKKVLQEHCIGKVHKCYYENQFVKMFKAIKEIADTPLGLDNHEEAIIFKGIALKSLKNMAKIP